MSSTRPRSAALRRRHVLPRQPRAEGCGSFNGDVRSSIGARRHRSAPDIETYREASKNATRSPAVIEVLTTTFDEGAQLAYTGVLVNWLTEWCSPRGRSSPCRARSAARALRQGSKPQPG